jgi:protein-S-isoprenylcysteine O-methyltransferase Ste14
MIPVYKLILFLVLSAALVFISRASLLKPRSHGFYRFFAWEVILAQALLNIEVWFTRALAWHQLISWLLLIGSLALAIHGAWLLKQVGAQDAKRSDSPMLGFEKTTRLVVIGAYRYIRHPLYASLLFLSWGVYFKDPNWPGFILVLAASGLLWATARAEEAEDVRFFGEEYREYMKKTAMFFPFLF